MQKSTNQAIFVVLTTILALSAIVIPMQTAKAQGGLETIIIRLVGGVTSGGLISVVISVDDIVVTDVIDVNRNNIGIPITAPIDVNIPITVCALAVNVLGDLTGDQSCRTVNNVEQFDIITLPLRQISG